MPISTTMPRCDPRGMRGHWRPGLALTYRPRPCRMPAVPGNLGLCDGWNYFRLPIRRNNHHIRCRYRCSSTLRESGANTEKVQENSSMRANFAGAEVLDRQSALEETPQTGRPESHQEQPRQRSPESTGEPVAARGHLAQVELGRSVHPLCRYLQ